MLFFLFPSNNLNRRWALCKDIIKEKALIKKSYTINFSKKRDNDFKKLIKMIYCVSDDSHEANIHKIESKIDNLCKFSKKIKVIETNIDPNNVETWMSIKNKIRQKAGSRYSSVHTPAKKYVNLTKYYLSLFIIHNYLDADIDKERFCLKEKNILLSFDDLPNINNMFFKKSIENKETDLWKQLKRKYGLVAYYEKTEYIEEFKHLSILRDVIDFHMNILFSLTDDHKKKFKAAYNLIYDNNT